MASRRAIGIIVPSGNIVVERVAIAWQQAHPDVGLHFVRVPVRGAIDPYPNGYDLDAFDMAADLLADAAPGALLWAGSKGVLVGLDKDEKLRDRIETRVGLPMTTASLALVDLVSRTGWRRIGLITPYTSAYQQRLVAGFAAIGLSCLDEVHSGIADNLAYADVGCDDIRGMARHVGASRPDMILAWCTNFAAAECADRIAAETSLPFRDANLLGLEAALRRLDHHLLDDGVQATPTVQ